MTDREPSGCPDCGADEIGAYCPRCGQDQRDARVSFGRWLAGLADEQLSLNGKLPRTLSLLVRRPGFLTAEWRSGRHTRYTRPLRLYVIASVVFFSVTFFLGLPFGGIDVDLTQLGTGVGSTPAELANDVIARRMQGFMTVGAILAVPLLALWMRILRRRTELIYLDHLIFWLHLNSVVLLALTLSYVLLFFGTIGRIAAVVPVLYVFGYWAMAWWRIYRPDAGWIRSGWSFGVATAGWGVLILVLAVGEILLASTMIDASGNAGPKELGSRLYVSARIGFTSGDTLRARILSEEALAAFGRVDADYLGDHDKYHMAELRRFASHWDDARSTTASLLAEDPGDLLSLGLAGVLAEAVGDSASASDHYGALLGRVEAGEPNTHGHASTFEKYLSAARSFLGEAGSP